MSPSGTLRSVTLCIHCAGRLRISINFSILYGPETVVKRLWLKFSPVPEEIQGVMNEGKYIIYLTIAAAKCFLTEALWSASGPNQMIIRAPQNLFVSPPSNGPSHGSFQPCDHNLQFHTWLCTTAQVVWIAWVRHIPSSISLFIVLIFHERFIPFRKSSRKHWMPISCWPAREGCCVETAWGGGMEI